MPSHNPTTHRGDTAPPIFSYLTFHFPKDEALAARPHDGIILTLPPAIVCIRCRSISPKAPNVIPSLQPLPRTVEEAAIHRMAALMGFSTDYDLHHVNPDKCNLLDYHTILHRIIPPFR